jgi:hypothetical protein
MITLYKVDYVEKKKKALSYDKKTYYTYKTRVEQYTPIKFPDTVFTYYGWTTDYNKRRIYRYYGTDQQLEFLMDNSLDSATSSVITPEQWLSQEGNYIEYIKFGSLCKFWNKIPVYQQNEILAEKNPSNDRDNVWLISYRQSSDVEVYLIELSYDPYNDVTRQELLPPRKDIDRMPGPDNIQIGDATNVEIEENSDYEYYTPKDGTAEEMYNDYKAHYSNNVLSFDYNQAVQNPSWQYNFDKNCSTQITPSELRELRCIEINLYANAFDVPENEDAPDDTYHRIEVYFPSGEEISVTEEDFIENVRNGIYVKIHCAEDVLIPETEDCGYLQIQFATIPYYNDEEGNSVAGTTVTFNIPLTTEIGQHLAGDDIYSVVYDYTKVRQLKIENSSQQTTQP